MNKPILYIDFDNTIVNSTKKIVEMWKRKHNGKSDYKNIHWTEIYTFGFEELNISKEEVFDYFKSKEFFTNLEYLDNAESIINLLIAEGWNIKVVSMGTSENLALKEKWVSENLPNEIEFIGINLNDYSNKSHIDMSDGILIDDEVHYLESSNAQECICFGDILGWNDSWTGKRCWNWYEVYNYITKKEK